jgi:hypothetical protein
MKLPSGSIWYVAGGCAGALAILVVLLFVIPAAAPPPPVQVYSIDWQLQQQAPQGGVTEFSEQWINQSGPYWGFPFDLPAGGTFNDSLVIINEWNQPVPICSASISPPLYIVSTFPSLLTGPMIAPASEDSLLTLTLGVHAGAGAVVSATGTVSGVGC